MARVLQEERDTWGARFYFHIETSPGAMFTVYSLQLTQIASKCLRQPYLMSTIKYFPRKTPSQICLEFQPQPQHGPS